jgi:cell division protein FtsL
MPRYSRKKTTRSPLFLFFAVPFLIYLCFLVGRTIYKNTEVNKELASIQDQINFLEAENDKLKKDIDYYKTDEYKIRAAREKLDMQLPGETVVVITPDDSSLEEVIDEPKEVPNFVLWWLFLTNTLDNR